MMCTSGIFALRFKTQVTEKIVAALCGLCFATLVLADTQPSQSEKTQPSEDNRKYCVEVKEKPSGVPFRKIIGFPLKIAFSPFYLIDHGLQKGLLAIEKRNVVPRIAYLLSLPGSRGISGIFGELGSGSGLGGGIGLSDTGLFDNRLRASVSAALSINLYQEYNASLERFWPDRYVCSSSARYGLKHREIFYGVGPGTNKSDTSFWGMEETFASLALRNSLSRTITISRGVDYCNMGIYAARDATTLTRDIYPDLSGLRGAELIRTGISLKHDSRDSPADPFSGGTEYLSVGFSCDIIGKPFQFFDYSFEMTRYFTVFKKGRKVSARLLYERTDPWRDKELPFFSMPRLGGFATLRGYSEDRFWGTQAACATLEYSYPVWRRSVDAVVFADIGQIFEEFTDVNLSALTASYGGGIRLKSPGKPIFGVEILRLEIARSAEGFRVMASVSPPFERQ
jgi:hypothetical protein